MPAHGCLSCLGVLRLLHLLPHAGGGGERHLDILAGLPDTAQRRMFVSSSRSAARALVGLPRRRVQIGRAAGNADVVHAHGDMASVLMCGVLRGHPSLWTTHGMSFLRRTDGARHDLFARRLRAVIAATQVTVCTTAAERDELLATVAAEYADRLRVVPNGIAPSPPVTAARREETRRALALTPGTTVGLFAGRLDEDKGVRDAIAATVEARSSGADLTLLVAGDGPLEDELRATGADGVRLLGYRDDVDELLGAADVFVLPSRREGSSYAVIEALGAGLAVVVCDGRGNPETVGDAGLVVPCGDVHALADALGELAGDASRRRALGATARARAEGDLGEERFLAEMDAIYREVSETASGSR